METQILLKDELIMTALKTRDLNVEINLFVMRGKYFEKNFPAKLKIFNMKCQDLVMEDWRTG